MEILASCSLEEKENFSGHEIIEKGNKVSFNIVVTNGDVQIFGKLDGSEKCVTFREKHVNSCPENWVGRVFNEYSLKELENGIDEIEGVTTLVHLDSEYKDMRTLINYTKKYPFIRFVGGNLLAIEGINIGRYDKGKEKMPIVFHELYDSFLEVESLSKLDSIEGVIKRNESKLKFVQEKVKKTSKSKKSGSSSGGSSKSTKRKETFSSLFGESSEDF